MNPLSDMFVSIVNAGRAHHERVLIPYSRLKMEIIRALQAQGYVGEAMRRGKKNRRMIEVTMIYSDTMPMIKGAKLVSKQSQRIYSGWRTMKKFFSNRGMVIVSTPKGIMTAREARKQKVGGEVIAKVW